MNGPHRVDIKIEPNSNGTEVTIDGVVVPQVRRVTVTAEANSASVVNFEVIACAVHVVGAVDEVTEVKA